MTSEEATQWVMQLKQKVLLWLQLSDYFKEKEANGESRALDQTADQNQRPTLATERGQMRTEEVIVTPWTPNNSETKEYLCSLIFPINSRTLANLPSTQTSGWGVVSYRSGGLWGQSVLGWHPSSAT